MVLFFFLVLLFIGLIGLWKIGELCVRNAIGFSMIYGMESFMIGFFIFAISTGLPEITSAFVSSIYKIPSLSAGNLMGASFANISLVLGIIALIAGNIHIDEKLRKRLFITISLTLLIFIGIAFVPRIGVLSGILLIIIYLGSIFWFRASMPEKQVSHEIRETEQVIEKIEKKAVLTPKVDIFIRLFGSLGLLVLSSWLTVYAARNIAQLLQVDLSFVGATFLAMGTTLPELALEIHAVRKREFSLALGDVFGSSLLNVSLILGILITFNPGIDFAFSRLILIFYILSIILSVWRLIQKKPILRRDGVILLALFALYIGIFIAKSIYTEENSKLGLLPASASSISSLSASPILPSDMGCFEQTQNRGAKIGKIPNF